MDRQNMIASSTAAVVLVAADALLFRPGSTERATVASKQSTGHSAAGDSAASSEDSDH